jgi:hypothetical protein
MLSPGHWHRLVPKSRTANLRFRLNLLRLCRRSRKCREAVREACRTDFLFWVNAFVWQYNPRKKAEGEVGPFITWDFQDDGSLEILRCIEEDDDVVIEKSREMGASWLCLLVILWLYLYHPWKKFLVISRSEAAGLRHHLPAEVANAPRLGQEAAPAQTLLRQPQRIDHHGPGEHGPCGRGRSCDGDVH